MSEKLKHELTSLELLLRKGISLNTFRTQGKWQGTQTQRRIYGIWTGDRCLFDYITSYHDAEFIVHAANSFAAHLEIMRVQRNALRDCVTLMSGAPSVAPLTDEMVLKRAHSALEWGEEIAKEVLG